MFPSVPGFGSRIWMMCVRAFGWLTETHPASMSCVCSVEGVQAGASVRNDMPSDPSALRRYDEFGVTWPIPEETVWRVLVQQVTQVGLEVGSAVPEPSGRGVRQREVAGHDGVDVSDQVRAPGRVEGARAAEPGLRQGVLEACRLALVPGGEVMARAVTEVVEDELPHRSAGNLGVPGTGRS